MTRQVRRVAGVMLVLFLALFANLNVIQVLRADDLANHPSNRRLLIREYHTQRGSILVGQQPVATSVPTSDELKYLRRYQPGNLYSHLMGYYSVIYGRHGLEAALNDDLVGTATGLLPQNLTQLLTTRDPVGNTVRLTIDPNLQAVASSALGDRIGAVVALDPRTGAVLAQVSHPDYDPNLLSGHDGAQIHSYWEQLQADPRQPLANRATEQRFQPGSTFKLIVAAAALERGLATPETPFPNAATYTPPSTTVPIHNFGDSTCGGGGSLTLAEALITSCNTIFARLGVQVGAEALVAQAQRFGFNSTPPYLLPSVPSVIPQELDPPATAQSSIGARDVQATPLQMAMVVAAIANKGVLMRPHVVSEVLGPSGRPVRRPDVGPWTDVASGGQAISGQTAATLANLMIRVVQEGTGSPARIPGVIVGGKTGTADPGEGFTPHVWFVGFAADPAPGGIVPRIAVAVCLPNAGPGATGGVVAGPIAKAVMEAAMGRTPTR